MSLGLALSFEIISSSIRIVLTRIRPIPFLFQILSQMNFFVSDSHLNDTANA